MYTMSVDETMTFSDSSSHLLVGVVEEGHSEQVSWKQHVLHQLLHILHDHVKAG